MSRGRVSKTALKRLAALRVAEHDSAVDDSYERRAFGYGWDDLDSDGQNERAEILIRTHKGPESEIGFATTRERRVVSGRWFCRFTGETFTDAGRLDIDHLVPLKDAWLSGAYAWTKDRRERYANGVGIKSNHKTWLVPVSASANRSKSDDAPHEWMPPRKEYHKRYAAAWIRTKHYWSLSVTAVEKAKLEEIFTGEPAKSPAKDDKQQTPSPVRSTREELIIAAILTFAGRRTRDGRPYVVDLRKHAGIPDITTQERDKYYRIVKGS